MTNAADTGNIDIRALLIAAGAELSSEVRERVLACGAEAYEPLLAVFLDEKLRKVKGPGQGYAPVHAVELLGDLGDIRAFNALLHEHRAGADRTLIYNAVQSAMPKLGQPALEPLLRAFEEEQDGFERACLASIMADLGVRDERIFQALQDSYQAAPDFCASSMASYGDERAVPFLQAALDVLDPQADWSAVMEARHTVEDLGGELSPEHMHKFELAVASRKRDGIEPSITAPLSLAERATLGNLEAPFGDRSGWSARGFLAAVASLEILPLTSAWLPDLFMGEPEPSRVDAAFTLYNATLRAMQLDRESLCPAAEDVDAIEAFCQGYMDVVSYSSATVAEEETSELLSLVAKLAGVGSGAQQEPETPALLATARQELPTILSALDGRLRNHVVQTPVRRAPKIGRNQPCPCGSGKKYKRCCINNCD